jgi:6-phosphogluconolactonase
MELAASANHEAGLTLPRLRLSVAVAALGLTGLAAFRVSSAPNGEYLVYIGTYTGFKFMNYADPWGQSRSQGIYVSRFQPATGTLSEPQLAARSINPGFLAVHPNHRFLYATNEDPRSLGPARDHASYVSAFAIDPASGKLTLLNTVPAAGTSTCYISLDKSGKYALLANFGSGSVSVLRIRDDGSLGELTAFMQHTGQGADARQTGPHPHSIDVSTDNRFAVVSDLGLDKLFVYRFDAANGSLSPDDPPSVSLPPGSEPRHFTFDPGGKFGYLVNERTGVVNAYTWDASRGVLTEIQSAGTLPKNFKGLNDSAEIAVHPNGKFLYESNRRKTADWGPDTIGVFSIDPAKGTLSPLEQVPPGGLMPRSFEIDPTGSYLIAANQFSDDVSLFRIDGETGRLKFTGKVLKVDAPSCIKFVPVE